MSKRRTASMRHSSFVRALQTAPDLPQLGKALAAECRQLSGARAAWCLLLSEDEQAPVLLGGPGRSTVPPILPEGIAAWVLERQQSLKLQPRPVPVFQVQPQGRLAGFRACRESRSLHKRLQQDLAWMAPACLSQALLWLPLTANALLILCRPAWTEASLEALGPALELGRLAWTMLERRHQLEQHARQTAAASEIAQNLSATLELDILLRLIILEITKTMRCQAGDIWLKPDKRPQPVFRTGLGISTAARGRLMAGNRTQQALESGEPVWIEDVAARTDLDQRMLNQEGIAGLAVIPLKVKSRAIGVLHLFAKRPRFFSQAERQLIKTLASQAALAIENARLFEETKRRAQELLALYEVAQLLSEISNVNLALKQIIERVSELLNVEKCWFLLWNEASGVLTAHPSAVGLDEEQIADLRLRADTQGVSAQVFRTGQTAVYNTAQEEASVREEFGRRFQLRTLLAVGLRHQDANLGVFLAANKRGEAVFDGNDVRLFRTLASEAAVVIQNARLYARLRRSYFSMVQMIAELVDAHEPYPAGHSERVANYAAAMALQMGLGNEEVEKIRMAGRLHDLGKLKLAAVSKSEMDRHPEVGVGMLEHVEFPWEITPLIRHHHETYDGQGYPDRLRGEAIPLGARIIAVADALDILTNGADDQPGQRTPAQSYQEITAQAGSRFDPEVVKALGEIWPGLFRLEEKG
ncbi:MAG: GAF domain-containing protein [candidate division FCPU426 bacterium]